MFEVPILINLKRVVTTWKINDKKVIISCQFDFEDYISAASEFKFVCDHDEKTIETWIHHSKKECKLIEAADASPPIIHICLDFYPVGVNSFTLHRHQNTNDTDAILKLTKAVRKLTIDSEKNTYRIHFHGVKETYITSEELHQWILTLWDIPDVKNHIYEIIISRLARNNKGTQINLFPKLDISYMSLTELFEHKFDLTFWVDNQQYKKYCNIHPLTIYQFFGMNYIKYFKNQGFIRKRCLSDCNNQMNPYKINKINNVGGDSNNFTGAVQNITNPYIRFYDDQTNETFVMYFDSNSVNNGGFIKKYKPKFDILIFTKIQMLDENDINDMIYDRNIPNIVKLPLGYYYYECE